MALGGLRETRQKRVKMINKTVVKGKRVEFSLLVAAPNQILVHPSRFPHLRWPSACLHLHQHARSPK